MRIVAAMFKHETNTFSPVPTPFERFGATGPLFGDAARDAYRSTRTPLGAFIDIAEEVGAELATPVAAEAWPSGPVEDEAYRRLSDRILKAVGQGCDLVLLDLHGAMVTVSLDDGEGYLVEGIREAVGPDVPIAVALDLHANVTDRLVRNATAIAGYKTYPHVDMYETGERVGRIGLAAAERRSRPAMTWGNRPMLPHIMRQATDDHPMRDLVAMAREAEGAGALAVSVFGGFPHADIRDAGLSVVTVTENDPRAGETITGWILDRAWAERQAFVYRAISAAEAIAHARAIPDGPVIVLDHADNCGSGGTMDVTAVLKEVMVQRLEGAVFFAIFDPAAVEAMAMAGVGSTVRLKLGGKLRMPAIGVHGKPLDVEGRVSYLGDGDYVIEGPMYTGVKVSMGRTAILDVDGVRVVVISKHHEPWDTGCLTSLGIDPRAMHYVILKSRVHWRAGFLAIARHIVEAAGEGVTTSDYGSLVFRNVRRPIYPLDPM